MIRTVTLSSTGLFNRSPAQVSEMGDNYQSLPIRVYEHSEHSWNSYLSPQRRDFYKVLMVTGGMGILTIADRKYYIDEPVMVLIQPSDIISWKKLSEQYQGYVCIFRKDVPEQYPVLKTTIERSLLFGATQQHIVRLSATDVVLFNSIFSNMQAEQVSGERLNEDAIQAYLQLLMIQSARITDFKPADHVSEEYKHVQRFFNMLERETVNLNYTNPISMKTAKEFAASLDVHPNYLNTLLKKHTGQNVSTHIRNRLLEEAKRLLLQTNWTLQDIGYSLGFAEQPNFSLFFKKNAGITPAEYRKITNVK